MPLFACYADARRDVAAPADFVYAMRQLFSIFFSLPLLTFRYYFAALARERLILMRCASAVAATVIVAVTRTHAYEYITVTVTVRRAAMLLRCRASAPTGVKRMSQCHDEERRYRSLTVMIAIRH